jgi:3-hydroxy acid dehydrogenase/malonic semialdehyde reductase
VNGLVRMTRLVLQRSLREPGHVVNIGSIAGRWAYPNGSSYVASKFAVRGFTRALREDLLGRDIRVTTVDAGLVKTEFSLVRFKGDAAQAEAVYEGTRPLVADDIAGCVLFAVTRPPHVVVDELVVMSIDQSSGARIHRHGGR